MQATNSASHFGGITQCCSLDPVLRLEAPATKATCAFSSLESQGFRRPNPRILANPATNYGHELAACSGLP